MLRKSVNLWILLIFAIYLSVCQCSIPHLMGERVEGDEYLFSSCGVSELLENNTGGQSVSFFYPNVNVTAIQMTAFPVKSLK